MYWKLWGHPNPFATGPAMVFSSAFGDLRGLLDLGIGAAQSEMLQRPVC